MGSVRACLRPRGALHERVRGLQCASRFARARSRRTCVRPGCATTRARADRPYIAAAVRSDPNDPLSKFTWNAPDAVAPQIIARIDEATREADQLVHWNGSEFVQLPW
jgi:hypothetical protein